MGVSSFSLHAGRVLGGFVSPAPGDPTHSPLPPPTTIAAMADKTVSVRLIARVGQYASEMNMAAGANSQFANSLTGATGKAQKAVMQLGTAAALAGKITLLGIGAAMVVSAKAAIDFESSLTGVAKTTGLAGAALENFGRGLRDLSLEIPVNVNELAQIAEIGGQLGVPTANLLNFTEVVAMLGVTTNLSTTEAATSLARFVNIMGSNLGDVDKFGSVIVELGNNFATTETEITKFALRLAPIGASIGISEQGVLALGAALSSLGIPAERGSTAIQRLFLDMENAVGSGSDRLDSFAEVAGVTAEEFARVFREDPVEALLLLATGLDGVLKSGGDVFETLKKINVGEQRAIGVALALANGNDVLRDSLAAANIEIEENNALYEEAALRFGTTESQIGLVANAFNDLRIEIGNAFLDTGLITGMLDTLREFLIVMRDNTDVLGKFAAGMAILSGLALINYFAGLAVEGLKTASAFRTALSSGQGLSATMNGLKLSSIGLNAAFGLAGAAALVVGAIWLRQARKAAELKSAIADLEAQIESGVTPAEALADHLRDALSSDQIRTLQEAGFTINGIADDLINGGDAAQFFNQSVVDAAKATSDRSLWEFAFGDVTGVGQANEIAEIMGVIGEEAEGLKEASLSKFVDEFRQLNPETKLTAEQIREMGMEIQAVNGINLDGWAQRTTDAMSQLAADTAMFNSAIANSGQSINEAIPSFLEFILGLEEGQKIYETWVGDITDATDTFAETIRGNFEDVTSSILSGKPAWDEYGEAAELNIDKILGAQQAFVEDMRAWANLQPALMAAASEETVAQIDAWEPQQKAALARLFESSEAEFFRFIDGLDQVNSDIDLIMMDIWQERMPAAIRGALPELIASIESITAAIVEDNPGLDTGEAYTAGIDQAIENFTEDEELRTIIGDYFADPWIRNELETHGMSAGAKFVLGIINGITSNWNQIITLMGELLGDLMPVTPIVPDFGGGGSTSPPITSPGGGGGGFFEGTSLKFSSADMMPVSTVASTQAVASNSTVSVINSISIPINNPESKDLNRAVDKAALKINAIVPMMERGWRF